MRALSSAKAHLMSNWISQRNDAINILLDTVEAQRDHPERSLRLTVDEIGQRVYDELDLREVRRFPTGFVKVAPLLPVGSPSDVVLEFVPEAAA